uniref:Uncharacterized protein n=1 Tax=Anguilla anguilla TaxID=7936 RepID=A0A0E9WSZ0_ANGAN
MEIGQVVLIKVIRNVSFFSENVTCKAVIQNCEISPFFSLFEQCIMQKRRVL